MQLKKKMTRFQALFVFWIRNEKLQGCSWRATAANYYNRYDMSTGNLIPFKNRLIFKLFTFGGNQLDGIALCEEASKILFNEKVDIYGKEWYNKLKNAIQKENTKTYKQKGS